MSIEEDSSVLDLAESYALDAIATDERIFIDRALLGLDVTTQEAFAQTVRQIQETMALLSSADSVEPAPELRSKVLSGLVDVIPATVGDTAEVIELGSRRKVWWRALGTVAAAVVLIAGGVVVGNNFQREPAQTAQSRSQLQSVEMPGGGSANLMISHADNTAYLVMSGIADPAPGTVYQMWLIPDQGALVSAGIMTSDDVGTTTRATLNDIGPYSSLGFSVEPMGGSAQPSAPPFVQIPLL
ncbi:MAG: anti-sigma factor [Mycobacteriaceae bacterium]